MLPENIIIEVESDKDDQQSKELPMRLKLPLKLQEAKPIEHKVVKTTSLVNNIVLPKDIRIKKFYSSIGTFHGEPVVGLYGTEFCKVDGYLFEYRLSKGKMR